MKRIIFSALLSLMAFGGSQFGFAQSSYSYPYGASAAAPPTPIWNYPRYGWGGGGYHASTYEAGVLSGMGNLYRGVGEYEVANSVAAYNWQLARSASLQNGLAERQARGVMYASVRMAHERQHQENIKKNQALAQFHAKQPKSLLADSQLNRTNGKVTWPALLKNEAFETNRLAAEETLAERFDKNQVSVGHADEALLDSIEQMKLTLEREKESIRPADYYAARAFLARLQNEIAPTSSQQIAKSF